MGSVKGGNSEVVDEDVKTEGVKDIPGEEECFMSWVLMMIGIVMLFVLLLKTLTSAWKGLRIFLVMRRTLCKLERRAACAGLGIEVDAKRWLFIC